MSETIFIPEELWKHKLFKNPIPVPSFDQTDLAIAICEKKLRLIKNMPSSSDSTASSLIEGYSKVIENTVKLIEQPSSKNLLHFHHLLLQRVRQSIIMVRTSFSPEIYNGIIRNFQRTLIEFNIQPFGKAQTAEEASDELEKIYLQLVDRIARSHATLAKKYWKHVYKIAENSLQFNETSDTIRLRPVFKWMIKKIEEHRIQNADYVDVGCSIKGGALNTILAAQIFRETGLCSVIHGTDVVKPERNMILDFWRKYKVFLYYAEPILHPLPHKYHIILLANVHRHLAFSAQKVLIQKKKKSLYENGILFINWRFDKENSPTLALKREKRSLSIDDEANTTGITQ